MSTSTKTSQRVGIWIIAIVLIAGTLGSFLVMALGVQNTSTDNTKLQDAYTEYSNALSAQTSELSSRYYDTFNSYSSLPAVFDADSVTEVSTKDLKVGDGELLTADSVYSAYYIGWNPYGEVFDQSIEAGSLKQPIEGGNLIEGWNEGVIGMRFGGVREISIPSDKAYGATGSGAKIAPYMPIKFVVMVIPKVEDVPIPEYLLNYYADQSL